MIFLFSRAVAVVLVGLTLLFILVFVMESVPVLGDPKSLPSPSDWMEVRALKRSKELNFKVVFVVMTSERGSHWESLNGLETRGIV